MFELGILKKETERQRERNKYVMGYLFAHETKAFVANLAKDGTNFSVLIILQTM